MFLQIIPVLKLFQIREHPAAFHMVSIDQRILIRKVPGASAVQEDTSGYGEFPIDVRVHIANIIFSLKNRMIDTRSGNSDPASDIRVKTAQLFKHRCLSALRIRPVRPDSLTTEHWGRLENGEASGKGQPIVP